ncbi:MAG: YfcC family protein [Ruminococcaceae bacterium]|nr:YfcC family protein [Oscillospiraceae bacterium]
MEVTANGKKRKKLEFPRPFAVMMILVLLFSILSYVIPSSSYDTMEVTYTQADGTERTRSVVDPDTWHVLEEQKHISFMQYITSFIRGMEAVPEIIFAIFICVGCFYVVGETGTITSGVGRLIMKMGKNKFLVIPILATLFAIMASTVGTYEEMLCFIPILAPIMIGAGYDSLIVIGIVMCGGAAGFAGATTNTYTLGVAQGIAGLPMFSGMSFHIIALAVFIITLDLILIYYAKRLEKDQSRSLMYEMDKVYLENNHVDFSSLPEFNKKRKAILAVVVIAFAIVIWGILKRGWYFEEMSGVFMVMGVIAALIYGEGINWFCDQLVAGMKTIVVGAMMVGFARAILVVLNDAAILHTILHGAASVVSKLPDYMAVVGQYIFQCLMNYIIPSGSGQATATMPIMAPLAEMTGLTRQVAVQCEVIGDGLSNPFTPTSGNIHAGLAMAGIPYVTWVKFWWKFLCIEYAVGLIVVIVANVIALGPF